MNNEELIIKTLMEVKEDIGRLCNHVETQNGRLGKLEKDNDSSKKRVWFASGAGAVVVLLAKGLWGWIVGTH